MSKAFTVATADDTTSNCSAICGESPAHHGASSPASATQASLALGIKPPKHLPFGDRQRAGLLSHERLLLIAHAVRTEP
jgi:hypothetical protein